MFQKVKDFPRNFLQGIESLCIWFPVIWRDRQWDHQYIYQVFRHKLHLTERLIRHYGHHVKHIEDADKIKVCVNLLDRLMKDEYHETAFKRHKEKWGRANFEWIPIIDKPDACCSLNITHPNVITDEDKESERKDFKNACNHEDALREQDLDLLFKMMRKHIQSWWD